MLYVAVRILHVHGLLNMVNWLMVDWSMVTAVVRIVMMTAVVIANIKAVTHLLFFMNNNFC